MKRIIVSVLAVLMSVPAMMADNHEMKAFVDKLMSKMTVKEKIGQLNLVVAGDITTGKAADSEVGGEIAAGSVGGVFNIKGVDGIRALQEVAVKKSRLGIPLLVGMDVIHGYETIFPIPLAQSCSWDMEAIEKGARIAAKEASADGINWTFSPMVDICVDARWGRVAEGGGEDPFLGSRIAEAMVRGYQGDYSQNSNIMACLKHFALYGGAEAGRDYNTVDMSRVRMFNQYLPPYKAAVDAGVSSVMSSFNIVDGVPATGNRWLLTELLRDTWHFGGLVASDYGSIGEMMTHGLGDLPSVSAQALKAGTDMDMCTRGFVQTLEKSLEEGRVSMSDIDNACRRVLEAKYILGLFDDPYKFCDGKRRKKDIFTEENRRAARDMAAETFVLLKNDSNLLPLEKKGKIALIGPLADTRANMAGTWCVAYTPDRYSTLKEGLERAVAGKAEILYAQGCNLTADAQMQKDAEFGRTIKRGDDNAMRAEALRVARDADVIVCAMGESSEMSGESSSRSDLTLPMQAATGQVPIYYNHLPTGRPVPDGAKDYRKYQSNYLDVRNDPLYPFGYGLSYTTFAYSDLTLSKGTLAPGGSVRATVTVTNTGSRDGYEVVQMYIHDRAARISRPVKELKGFSRIHLAAGESKDVSFDITPELLKYYDSSLRYGIDPGEVEIMVGPDSRNLKKAVLNVE